MIVKSEGVSLRFFCLELFPLFNIIGIWGISNL